MHINYFKMSRHIFESDLWHDVSTFRLFMLLIGKATHQDGTRTAGIRLQKGQYVRSYEKLAEDLAYKVGRGHKAYSKQTIYTCVQKLVKAKRISIKEVSHGTLFTVLNYEKYQEPHKQPKKFAEIRLNESQIDGELSQKYNNKAIQANKAKDQDQKIIRRKRVYDVSSMHYKLAQHFYEQIKRNNPEHLEPDLQKWADDIRKMMELDKRTEEQIRYLIDWAQQDDFEMSVVLSPAKLRKRFDALVIKVRQQKRQPAPVETIAATKYEYDYGF
ncbi:hypothetical protein QR721_11295 [Aciduricibacillus chroicocephali]|uniref:Replication protein n=1 Tax=Aciduricibacillus chroicocephali TaxID=3054939 RepID=A0ABY9KUJ7_9BACI|nr:hypothetical protein QR721_11295 [Bacillaceae bacterium 44XB]